MSNTGVEMTMELTWSCQLFGDGCAAQLTFTRYVFVLVFVSFGQNRERYKNG